MKRKKKNAAPGRETLARAEICRWALVVGINSNIERFRNSVENLAGAKLLPDHLQSNIENLRHDLAALDNASIKDLPAPARARYAERRAGYASLQDDVANYCHAYFWSREEVDFDIVGWRFEAIQSQYSEAVSIVNRLDEQLFYNRQFDRYPKAPEIPQIHLGGGDHGIRSIRSARLAGGAA